VRRWRRAALVAALLFAGGFAYARFWWGPGPEALALERRLREQARLRDGAGEGLLVGVPAGVAERLVGEAVAAFGSGIRVTLRDLRFRKADEVQARFIVEAMAAGCVPVLQPSWEGLFGKAAVYCEPSDVERQISDLHQDVERYLDLQSRGVAWAETHHGHGLLAEAWARIKSEN